MRARSRRLWANPHTGRLNAIPERELELFIDENGLRQELEIFEAEGWMMHRAHRILHDEIWTGVPFRHNVILNVADFDRGNPDRIGHFIAVEIRRIEANGAVNIRYADPLRRVRNYAGK